jgi:hypothetical protein
MSRSSALVVVVFVVVLVAVVATFRHVRHVPPTTRTATLENGIVVDVAHVDGQDARAAAALLFRVGADHDPPGRSGLASVLRRVVRARIDAGTFAAHVDVHGDGAFTVLSTTGTPGEVDATLRALGRLLAAPGVTDDVVTAARAAASDEAARRRGGDPLLAAESWALESAAPSRAQGWRGGVADELSAVTRTELETFWRAVFGADVAHAVVVGDVDVDDAFDAVRGALGALPRSTGASLRSAPSTFVHGTLVMGDQPRAVAFATPGPAPDAPSFAPYVLLAARLSNAASSTTTPVKVEVHFDPAMGSSLTVTSSLAEGESADAGAARLRAFVGDVTARPFAVDERAAATARYAAFFDDGAAVRDLRAVAVARARRAQLGVTAEALATALTTTTASTTASTTALADGAVWFDEQHAAVAAAGGVLR